MSARHQFMNVGVEVVDAWTACACSPRFRFATTGLGRGGEAVRALTMVTPPRKSTGPRKRRCVTHGREFLVRAVCSAKRASFSGEQENAGEAPWNAPRLRTGNALFL